MSGGELFRLFVVVFVIAPALVGADLAVSEDWVGSDPEASGGKRVEHEVRALSPGKPKIDLSLGSSFFYDSNPRLTPNGTGTGVATIDLGANFKLGDEIGRGAFCEVDYGLTGYRYSDSSLDPPGGNAPDHRVSANLGLNLPKTKSRLTSHYSRNSGHVVDFDGLNRESRTAESDDFALDFLVARELPHGSLEARTGSYLHSFREKTLNDGRGEYGDLAWYYRPGFAPKSDLGIAFRFGSDNYDGSSKQRFRTPSLRARHRLSGKTTLFSSVGYEIREVNSPANQSSERLVYNAGVAWAPTPKTSVELTVGQSVNPSFNSGNGNYESTEAIMKIHKRLGRKFVLTGSAGVEDASYFAAPVGPLSNRDDLFFKSGVNLMHPMKLGPKLDGEVNVFYSYNRNDSTIDLYDFEQHVTGMRFGFVY